MSSMFFTGCASNWSYHWEKGSEQKRQDDTGKTKTDVNIRLEISEQGAGNPQTGYVFDIKKDVSSANYREFETERYAIDKEYRTSKSQKGNWAYPISGIPVLAGLIGGFIWGYNLGGSDSDYEDESFDPRLFYGVGGAVLGSGAGMLVSIPIYLGIASIEKGERTEYAGNSRRRSLSTKEDWILQSRETESSGVPASGIPLILSSSTLTLNSMGQEGKKISVPSNSIGSIKVKIVRGLENWSSDKSTLISRLDSDKRSQSIKLTARPAILANLLSYVKPESPSFEIKTDVIKGSEYAEVNNAKKTIYLSGYGVPSNAFETACEEFIDQEINSHIKRVQISFKDMDSRDGISKTSILCETESRTTQSLLSYYFEPELVQQYADHVDDFESGAFTRSTSGNGVLAASLYVPCLLTINMTHPKYGTVKQEIYLTEGSVSKVVFVPKTGSGRSIKVEDL